MWKKNAKLLSPLHGAKADVDFLEKLSKVRLDKFQPLTPQEVSECYGETTGDHSKSPLKAVEYLVDRNWICHAHVVRGSVPVYPMSFAHLVVKGCEVPRTKIHIFSAYSRRTPGRGFRTPSSMSSV